MSLTIRREGTSTAWKVWPVPDAIPAGEVKETGTYILELTDSPGADQAVLAIDGTSLDALRSTPDTGRWRWSPGFYAGVATAELTLPHRLPVRFELITDPDLRKLTRQDFDLMVREILEDTFALFSLSSFRKGVSRGTGTRPPAIARLEFLRSRVEELERVVARIAAKPRRRLKPVEVEVPYYSASRITGPEILSAFRTGKIQQATAAAQLSPNLRGFLPARIKTKRRSSSLDLTEHRQMAACLKYWSEWLSAVTDLLNNAASSDPERKGPMLGWASRCRQLSQRLGRLADNDLFADAGEAAPTLTLTALFRNDAGYRGFYDLWRDMNAGIAAIFGDFLSMPLARTFDLYELWCFLRLVRAGVAEFGSHSVDTSSLFVEDSEGGLTIASGSVRVSIGANWALCFQKQYREFWLEADSRGSFSRLMTPDIALEREVAGTDTLIVLDAKYRIEEGLNDGLSSIHTYRDAIVRENGSGKVVGIVSAAYLLAPHVPALSADYRSTAMPSRLFHPEYRSSFRFGAVTLRPGMPLSEISSVLRVVIDDAKAA